MKTHFIKSIRSIATVLLLAAFALCSQAQTIKVAVFSINDFHGGIIKDARKKIPGAPAVWQTLDSLRSVYPYSVTVSAGDNFGGSYFYTATEGVVIPDFFNKVGITISAVGNHEFDDGQEKLADRWSSKRPEGWDLTYLAANVTDQSGKLPSYIKPCTTTDIALPGGDKLTVGIVGLLTSNTPNQTSKSKWKGLSFNGNYTGVINSLKSTEAYKPVADADIRILLMHVGTRMDGDKPVWNDRDSANIATFNDPDFHGLFTGHAHEVVCGRINSANYPVVQGKWHAEYIGAIVFDVDLSTKQVVGAEPKLIPVNPDVALGEKQLAYSMRIDSLLNVTEFSGHKLSEVLTTCTEDLEHDRTKNKYIQTEMGEMVCQSYAEAVREAGHFDKDQIIIGVSHTGSIRGGFPKGKIRILDIGEALPFANKLHVYNVRGSIIKDLVEFGLHNKVYGWLQTSRLEIDTTKTGNVKRLIYKHISGKKTEIKNKDYYLLVADEFLAGGGDGYSTDFFPASQRVLFDGLPTSTKAFIKYLQKRESVPGDARPDIRLYHKFYFKKW